MRKRVALSITLLTALSMLLIPAIGQAQEIDAAALYRKALPSIMTLKVETLDGRLGTGTAFLAIKDGVAVTAWHVVNGANHVTAHFSSGEEFEVSGLVDKDESRDVALIRVKEAGRPLLPLATVDPPIGSRAYVIGAPKGLEFSITDGIVSQLRTLNNVQQIQFSCAVSPGNSGGPLLNAAGAVLGIVSWQLRDSQNLNFAIPVNYARGLDSSLPTQPWNSVKASSKAPAFAPEVAEATITDEAFDKLLANTVMDGTDMAVTNLYILTRIIRPKNGFRNGLPAFYYSVTQNAVTQLRALQGAVPGDIARGRLRRNVGDSLRNQLACAALLERAINVAQDRHGFPPEAATWIRQAVAAVQSHPTEILPEDLSAIKQSSTFLNALSVDEKIRLGFQQSAGGVQLNLFSFTQNPLALVLVQKDGLGDRLGLHDGDVLVSGDKQTFTTVDDLAHLIAGNAGKPLTLQIIRAGKSQDLAVVVPSDLPIRK